MSDSSAAPVRVQGNTPTRFRIMISALALLAILVVAQPASATTYTFSIPVGTQVSPNPNTLMWALASALANDGFADNLTQFAFYDFYVRPQIAADGCLVSTDNCLASHDPGGMDMAPVVSGNTFNLISDYSSMLSATAPVPGCVSPRPSNCVSTYDATLNKTDPHGGGNSVEFRFDPADNTVALVTENPNAGNQSYATGGNNPFPAGATTEIMPANANLTFSFTTNSYFTFQTPVITFQIYALAIKYTTAGGTTLSAKDQSFTTNLDLVGSAPEPSTLLGAAGGLCLLLAARWRRGAASPRV